MEIKGSLECAPWLVLHCGHDVASIINEYLSCVTYCFQEVKHYFQMISHVTSRDDKESYVANLFDFLVVHQEIVWAHSDLREQIGLTLEKLVNNEYIEWNFWRIEKYNEAFGCRVQVQGYNLNLLFEHVCVNE